ncbi:MAG: flagellar protein [bacterium]|nr:flagellar protein [bacterium]
MDVRTCRSCGRMYNHIGRGQTICPSCVELLEEKFREVKEYIRQNPHATLQQISDDMTVSIKQLKQWVREERLAFSEDSPVGLECENCGAMIRTGRFCPNCKGKINESLMSAIDKPKPIDTLAYKKDSGNRFRSL